MQTVEVELDPGETFIAEAGAMNWMEDGIDFEAKMGDGSQPQRGFMSQLLDVGKRAITGESILPLLLISNHSQKSFSLFDISFSLDSL